MKEQNHKWIETNTTPKFLSVSVTNWVIRAIGILLAFPCGTKGHKKNKN